jgi:glycosyltransferase involved in cell wall biosynthesis
MIKEIFHNTNNNLILYKELLQFSGKMERDNISGKTTTVAEIETALPEILFITSYPPRECGIATYSHDLVNAIQEKFGQSFSLKVCALEASGTEHKYPQEVKYILKESELEEYYKLAEKINSDTNLTLIFIQHEFGLFGGEYGEHLLELLSVLKKPVITTFHTVLPKPDINRNKIVQAIVALSKCLIVMTKNSADILEKDYKVSSEKIVIIPHGTHLTGTFNVREKKAKYQLVNRIILSTFGLLGSGKSIETALNALPSIIEEFPNVLYLIIGKTHPVVVKYEGEKYRDFLYEKVIELNLQNNVRFVNAYLSLEYLQDYLQLTDIYFFTSKDPHQAVSGTLAYAIACGCPVIATPIPHANELLDGAGISIDFGNSNQLSIATKKLLRDPDILQKMKLNALHKINPTAWQNSAIAHIELLQKNISNKSNSLKYTLPEISLAHIYRLTTNTGMIQFSKISTPDLESGYTLDDNSRALIAVTKHYQISGEIADLHLIDTYLNFIIFCQQADGKFLNYVDNQGHYNKKNYNENLEDSNGRAIWALGEFVSYKNLFNNDFVARAEAAIDRYLKHTFCIQSPRAIAFIIKGLHHYNLLKDDAEVKQIIISLADNLVSKYRGVSDSNWKWFEEYLTYANSLLPEALLCASLSTGIELYKNIAKSSFDFLLSVIFQDEKIKVVSNQGWHIKGKISNKFGEQPIDVAYTILALSRFYHTYKNPEYLSKMETAFNWFLGKNHLHRIVYNPSTGGCYDGLEEKHINLNQGAESTVSYLLARLAVEKYLNAQQIAYQYDEIRMVKQL